MSTSPSMSPSPSIDTLLTELNFAEWRLVSLSDMSVHGLPRWWATLHRHSEHGDYAIDCKFGEGASAQEALSLALTADVRHMQPKGEGFDTSRPPVDLFAMLDRVLPLANLRPTTPPLITRRLP